MLRIVECHKLYLYVNYSFDMGQILKKICDHPRLLTKRAAENVLEGMETVLSPEDAGVAEKLAKHLADVADRDDYEVYNDNVSCKISFIMSLLVSDV